MAPPEKPSYDRVFRNALLIDGTGTRPYAGELAIAGDKIAALEPAGSIEHGAASREHDLKGKALSPGFIDTHTHDDRIVLDQPDTLPKVSQGVTTVITGNCGISLAPVTFKADPPAPMNLLGSERAYEFPTFADYARAIRDTVPGVNVAALIGHSALRLATMSARRQAMRKSARCSIMPTRRWKTVRSGSPRGFSIRPTREPI